MPELSQAAVAINSLVLCYSPDWALLAAVSELYSEVHPYDDVICVSDVSELLALSARLKPQCVVLVLPARSHVGLLYSLRRQNPGVPLLILQDGVRVSDEAVADYVGQTRLMNIRGIRPDKLRNRLTYPQTQDVMSSPPRRRFLSGAVDDPETVGAVVSEIESGLYRRLSMQVRSVRLREEARLWFARGDPVQQIADRTATDIRIVYQRRTTLCQLLGTRPRELPLSLTVEWGNHIASDVL